MLNQVPAKKSGYNALLIQNHCRIRDTKGKPFTVRHDQVNAMLLNEFLKEHRRVGQQAATITQLTENTRYRASTAQRTGFENSTRE
jgi:hypothetical protein